jgi:SAM-dependent methyltransferase
MDLGAGTGLLSHALARLLGPSGRVYAIDRDTAALSVLHTSLQDPGDASAEVLPIPGDFLHLDTLDALTRVLFDGALLANALHFAPDASQVLRSIVHRLRGNGRVVIVEYDRRSASRWVPFPVPVERLEALAIGADLEPPHILAERPSAYGGTMYCAVLEHPG